MNFVKLLNLIVQKYLEEESSKFTLQPGAGLLWWDLWENLNIPNKSTGPRKSFKRWLKSGKNDYDRYYHKCTHFRKIASLSDPLTNLTYLCFSGFSLQCGLFHINAWLGSFRSSLVFCEMKCKFFIECMCWGVNCLTKTFPVIVLLFRVIIH